MSTPHLLAEHIAEVAPDLLDEFKKGYAHPTYTKVKKKCWRCDRCASLTDNKKGHSWYHYELSLGIFALGGSIRYLLEQTDALPK